MRAVTLLRRRSLLTVPSFAVAFAAGCYPHRSIDDLKALDRTHPNAMQFVAPAKKAQIDELVPLAAAQATLDVEEKPKAEADPWVLWRPVKLETAAFWVRVDTIAEDDRTRVCVSFMIHPTLETWTVAAELATTHFSMALTALAHERGVWR